MLRPQRPSFVLFCLLWSLPYAFANKGPYDLTELRNQDGLNACQMLDEIQSACPQTIFANSRGLPFVPDASDCTCNSVFFNVFSACALFSGFGFPLFQDLQAKCRVRGIEIAVGQIPYQSISLPPWAYLPPSDDTTFNAYMSFSARNAIKREEDEKEDHPMHTWLVVVIAVVIVVVVALAGFFIWKLRHSRQSASFGRRRPWYWPFYRYQPVNKSKHLKGQDWSIDDDTDERFEILGRPGNRWDTPRSLGATDPYAPNNEINNPFNHNLAPSARHERNASTTTSLELNASPWLRAHREARKFFYSLPLPWKKVVAVRRTKGNERFNLDGTHYDPPPAAQRTPSDGGDNSRERRGISHTSSSIFLGRADEWEELSEHFDLDTTGSSSPNEARQSRRVSAARLSNPPSPLPAPAANSSSRAVHGGPSSEVLDISRENNARPEHSSPSPSPNSHPPNQYYQSPSPGRSPNSPPSTSARRGHHPRDLSHSRLQIPPTPQSQPPQPGDSRPRGPSNASLPTPQQPTPSTSSMYTSDNDNEEFEHPQTPPPVPPLPPTVAAAQASSSHQPLSRPEPVSSSSHLAAPHNLHQQYSQHFGNSTAITSSSHATFPPPPPTELAGTSSNPHFYPTHSSRTGTIETLPPYLPREGGSSGGMGGFNPGWILQHQEAATVMRQPNDRGEGDDSTGVGPVPPLMTVAEKNKLFMMEVGGIQREEESRRQRELEEESRRQKELEESRQTEEAMRSEYEQEQERQRQLVLQWEREEAERAQREMEVEEERRRQEQAGKQRKLPPPPIMEAGPSSTLAPLNSQSPLSSGHIRTTSSSSLTSSPRVLPPLPSTPLSADAASTTSLIRPSTSSSTNTQATTSRNALPPGASRPAIPGQHHSAAMLTTNFPAMSYESLVPTEPEVPSRSTTLGSPGEFLESPYPTTLASESNYHGSDQLRSNNPYLSYR